jgi:hypothetical protein
MGPSARSRLLVVDVGAAAPTVASAGRKARTKASCASVSGTCGQLAERAFCFHSSFSRVRDSGPPMPPDSHRWQATVMPVRPMPARQCTYTLRPEASAERSTARTSCMAATSEGTP